MENGKVVRVEESKPKQQKKKGKIAQVYKLHQKGVKVKEIAQKMKLSETVVRSYIWRSANPEKYGELLQRYFAKKKGREKSSVEAVEAENETEEK